MRLRDQLLKNPSLNYHADVFYENDIQNNEHFSKSYLKLREKENRNYDDHIVSELPEFDKNHRYKKEWDMRKSTLNALIKFLRHNASHQNIMELGCGNGWLAHNLATSLNADICAVDVNKVELLQGARVFKNQQNLCFVYTDIFSPALREQKFNAIILAGSVQYFRNLKQLISRLLEFTSHSGKIYLADSPFYESAVDAEAARRRSMKHFNSLGFPEMAEQYFHHTFDELKEFNYKILYNPSSLVSLIKRKILKRSSSTLPLICIYGEI